MDGRRDGRPTRGRSRSRQPRGSRRGYRISDSDYLASMAGLGSRGAAVSATRGTPGGSAESRTAGTPRANTIARRGAAARASQAAAQPVRMDPPPEYRPPGSEIRQGLLAGYFDWEDTDDRPPGHHRPPDTPRGDDVEHLTSRVQESVFDNDGVPEDHVSLGPRRPALKRYRITPDDHICNLAPPSESLTNTAFDESGIDTFVNPGVALSTSESSSATVTREKGRHGNGHVAPPSPPSG